MLYILMLFFLVCALDILRKITYLLTY